MQHLPASSLYFLLFSLVLGASATILFATGRTKLAVAALVLASGIIAYVFATADPFLHLWDEQFHALVSKNLLKHPFKPTLYDDPVFPYDLTDWSSNHVWLHKQPLFLWQMALSQSIFGSTELGVRFPDALLHALLTFFIYDLGRMFLNERTGFLAAIVFTFLNFPLELVSGSITLDHNDFSFLFYVTASFWALFKYRDNFKPGWIYWIGFFSGCAILVKWLPGLLVFLCWGAVFLTENFRPGTFFKNSKPFISALLVTLGISLPWQIYCFLRFPAEFKQEMLYNGLHVTQALQGHEGDWTFHFVALNRLYGEGTIVPLLLAAALLFLFFHKKVSTDKKIIVLTAVVFVYCFYSIVQTKMIAFPLIVLPLVLILLSNLLISLLDLLKNKTIRMTAFSILCIASGLLFLDLNRFLKSHTLFYKPEENNERYKDILEARAMRDLRDRVDKNTVVFNARTLNLRMMFYTEATTYPFIPTEQDCAAIKQMDRKIVVLDRGDLPDYIRQDTSIQKIPFVKF